MRDEELEVDIKRVWEERLGGVYGARKMRCLMLTFSNVSEFSFRRNTSIPSAAFTGHMQWVVDSVEVHAVAPWEVEFWGGPQIPRVAIHFQELSCEELSHATVEKLAPGWRRPGQPLARAGWKAMLSEIGSRRGA